MEKVLIIMDNDHAAKVRAEIKKRNEMCSNTSPAEQRIHRAVITALQTIWNKPDGWYDAELRAKLARMILPRLSRAEFTEVMTAVYVVVKPREDNVNMQRLRMQRRAKLETKS